MADRSRIRYGNNESPTASPGTGRKKLHQSPSSRTKHHISAPGHNFRKVTLTKPTYCHHCTDFIWGLAGFLCEVCNFMSHEKCLKHVKTVCSWMASTLVRVPVSHCFSPLGHKKKFCSVCRKQLEESSALRCEVCELHVHVDCAPFSFSDCRQCHHDGHQDHDICHHHWREGNLSSSARCEVCKRTCGSSEVLSGMRCEWCGITAHASCYIILLPECKFGRLKKMILPPNCVRVNSRNFSKMHCFRISESSQKEPDDSDDVDRSVAGNLKETQSTSSSDSSKQTLKIFDGNDAVKRNQFRTISVPRIAKNEQVVEAALRVYYIPDEPQDYELQIYCQQVLVNEDITNCNGATENPKSQSVFKESVPEAWVLQAKPKESEVLKIYAGWLKC